MSCWVSGVLHIEGGQRARVRVDTHYCFAPPCCLPSAVCLPAQGGAVCLPTQGGAVCLPTQGGAGEMIDLAAIQRRIKETVAVLDDFSKRRDPSRTRQDYISLVRVCQLSL